jgi:hypothetical protein
VNVNVNVNPEHLAGLAQRNAAANAFLGLVADQPRMRREASVDAIVERTSLDRRDVVRALRELESHKAGRLIVGRRKQKTRFVWSDRFDVLATVKKALLLASIATPPAGTMEADDAPAVAPQTGSVPMIRHRYVLRQSFEVELNLPADLSPREAERLSDFLKTLPFDRSE